ncbi:peptidyl-tRNA hydrolase, mitochondrial-like isoform X2 [Lycium ferocissimum]|uniref:peptidyl-tRNA hydrolase, mitochondrial-like isoform X2 n=1 Tax=Lycium ferocissimum TaxID=112874 RepID=UPI002814D40E|nr:peptidyl-tRNA hydrolase, mitochondrial-like isoform X2 [Lycium ferocissimum]
MRCLEGFVGATCALVLLSRGSLLGWAILGINTREQDTMLALKCLMHSQSLKGFIWRQYIVKLCLEKTGPLAAYYKLPLNRVVVFHDDMDLPCGVLRLHPEGGHYRHNGLKSVIYHFRGNREFPRLRIGIGRPPGQMDPKAFKLQKFNATARERIDAALREGAHALEQVLAKGFSESSRCFNTMQKYKHIRLQTLPT